MITIIVLLILAGVSIAMLTGDNGLLTKAESAKEETRGASVQEARDLWKTNQEADKNTKDETAKTLEDLLNDLESQKLITSKERVTIEETGEVTIGSRNIVFKEKELTDYVKIGDYVDYNPTVSDKSGTLVETSKLSYSSPKGTGKEHGNGNSIQNFTATADTKWRVLNIENGTVELISEDVIKPSGGSNFYLKGTSGFLYAEQELNEVCKIFGYGYGADITKGGNYTVGGPLDTPITGRIEGTGARSITIEDINKKAGVYEDKSDGQMKYSDGTIINSSYGNTTNPTSNLLYPTINEISGYAGPGGKNLKYTDYMYDKSKIASVDVQNMLFNGANYWVSTRCFSSEPDAGYYHVRYVYEERVSSFIMVEAYAGSITSPAMSIEVSVGVRPVVSLKSDVIDINTDYSTEGEWKLK